jgi:hypothetical protein
MKSNCFRPCLFTGLIFLFTITAFAQYPPAVGQPGTTAMYKDSSAFISWAMTCTVKRGFVNIADTNFLFNNTNKATYGIDYYGVGKANDSVVSLGDGGIATLTFDPPVNNGPGFDFAVFENSYSDEFLELAFVEVSSDGVNYSRFPAVSLTQFQTQVGTFGSVDPAKINNLAGKYRFAYGTPFDLDSLPGDPLIDLNHITHMRIIDAVGCIQPAYASYDSKGNIINDPWPTPFWQCGFDLDAVGVIHHYPQAIDNRSGQCDVRIFPNPVSSNVHITLDGPAPVDIAILDITGRIVLEKTRVTGSTNFEMGSIPGGVYFVRFLFPDGTSRTNKIIRL